MRSSIIAHIISKIFPNNTKYITAQKLQDVLVDMTDNFGVLGEDAGLRDHDPTRVYAVGDTCIKGNVIFRALDEVQGVFNPADWQPVAQMPVVNTTAERDAISFRFEGMICYVKENLTTYRLVGGVSNAHWQDMGRIELHSHRFKPTVSGQQNFEVPHRPIITLTINGVNYGAGSYTLSNGDGNTQNLQWDIDQFLLDEDDVLEIIYSGSKVILMATTAVATGIHLKQIDGLLDVVSPSPIASVVAPVLPSDGGYWGVAFGNGVWSVAGRSNTNWLISTDNAISWQITPGPNRDYGFLSFGGGWFISMAQLAGSNIARSEDGINWVVSGNGSYWQAADYGDGVWMACSWSNQLVKRSEDNGATWGSVSVPEGNAWRDIKYGDGVWMIAGNSTTTTYNLMRSVDGGLTFEGITLPSAVSKLHYGSGLWHAWSDGIMYRSVDGGQVWTEVETGYSGNGDMVWTGAYFIKFSGNKILWSEDGLQWRYDSDLPTGVSLIRQASYNKGTIVGTSNNNKLVVVRLRTPVYAGDPVSLLENDAGYVTEDDVPQQVNADWEADDGPAEILNKPDISPKTLHQVLDVGNEIKNGVMLGQVPNNGLSGAASTYGLFRGNSDSYGRIGIGTGSESNQIILGRKAVDRNTRLEFLDTGDVYLYTSLPPKSPESGYNDKIYIVLDRKGLGVVSRRGNGGRVYFDTNNVGSGQEPKVIFAAGNMDFSTGSTGYVLTKQADGSIVFQEVPEVTIDPVTWAGIQNKPTEFPPAAHTHGMGEVTGLTTALGDKVDKVTGKELSSNDYTTADKNKLAGISAGAQVNVQSDWDAASGDAFIKNKPTLYKEENTVRTRRAYAEGQGSEIIDAKIVDGVAVIHLSRGNMFVLQIDDDVDIAIDSTNVEYGQNISILVISEAECLVNLPGFIVLGGAPTVGEDERLLINISYWDDLVEPVAVINNLG